MRTFLTVIIVALILILAGYPSLPAEDLIAELLVKRYVEGYNQGYLAAFEKFEESYSVTFDADWRWGVDGEFLLTIEECINRSLFAANSHAALAYKYEDEIDHNIYWMNVHNSCAYWLEQTKN